MLLGKTDCTVVLLRRKTVWCGVCSQILSAEGSSDEQEMRKEIDR